MGKTETGAVWLSAGRTSPYQFYQYWINVDDADAGKCLRFLTELSREEIEALDAAPRRQPAGARKASAGWPRNSRGWCMATAGLAAARRATEIFFGAEIDQLSRRPAGRDLCRRAEPGAAASRLERRRA